MSTVKEKLNDTQKWKGKKHITKDLPMIVQINISLPRTAT